MKNTSKWVAHLATSGLDLYQQTHIQKQHGAALEVTLGWHHIALFSRETVVCYAEMNGLAVGDG